MAKQGIIPTPGSTSVATMPVSLQRTGAYPLEEGKLQESVSKALEYATNRPVAYYGQTIEIYVSEGHKDNGVYRIDKTSEGTVNLVKLADKPELDAAINALKTQIEGELSSGLADVGYKGSYTDMISMTTLKRGMVFNVLSNEINTLLTKFPNANIESGDWLLVKEDIAVNSLNSSNFNDYIGSWEKNLTGAVTVAKTKKTTTLATTVITNVTKELNDSKIIFVEEILPVQGVNDTNIQGAVSTYKAVTKISLNPTTHKLEYELSNIEYPDVTAIVDEDDNTVVPEGKQIVGITVEDHKLVFVTADLPIKGVASPKTLSDSKTVRAIVGLDITNDNKLQPIVKDIDIPVIPSIEVQENAHQDDFAVSSVGIDPTNDHKLTVSKTRLTKIQSDTTDGNRLTQIVHNKGLKTIDLVTRNESPNLLLREYFTGSTENNQILGNGIIAGAIYTEGNTKVVSSTGEIVKSTGINLIVVNRNNGFEINVNSVNISVYYNGLLLTPLIDYTILDASHKLINNSDEEIILEGKKAIINFNSSTLIDTTDIIELIIHDTSLRIY